MCRILLIFMAVLLVGCATTSSSQYEDRVEIDREMEIYGFDFTEYAEEGFLITPETYTGEYESIGIIQVTLWPKMKRSVEGRDEQGNLEYSEWRSEQLPLEAAVDSLYRRSSGMGADALINFDSERVTREVGRATRVGVQARGFAINRTNN